MATISYMIIWMTRHSREIKAELEGEAASALARGSAMALVGMAFLAVLREGFETSVFLLAAFQDATNTTAAGAGAVLGLLGAVAIGVGLYRGGVHINLSKFFKITGAGARLRRRRPARDRRPHRPRGGLDQQLPVRSGEPALARPPGHGLRIAAHRDARPAPGADPDRGLRLPRLRVPMALFVLWPRGSAQARRRGAEQRGVGAAQTPA